MAAVSIALPAHCATELRESVAIKTEMRNESLAFILQMRMSLS